MIRRLPNGMTFGEHEKLMMKKNGETLEMRQEYLAERAKQNSVKGNHQLYDASLGFYWSPSDL